MRIGEVVRLRVEDVDHDRRLLHIHGGRGRDRYVLLSPLVSRELRRYTQLHRLTHWLFPGAVANRPLSARSVRKLISAAVRRAGIEKHTTAHFAAASEPSLSCQPAPEWK